MNELTLRQWHHGYLGLIIITLAVLFRAEWLAAVGFIILYDDLTEHIVQLRTKTEWQSPLRRLYGYVWRRVAFIRHLNGWLDHLMKGRLQLRVDVLQGYEVPRWYGVAWNDYNRDVGVCYIVPLNIIFGWVRLVWTWMRFHSVPRKVDTIRQAYDVGYREGYRQAVDDTP